MRKIAIFAALAISTVGFAQTGGRTLLDQFEKNLNSAKSFSATYVVQPIGGAPATYDVQLSKPNLARFDTPRLLVVADGTAITTYNKADKTYYKTPQTDQELQRLFSGDDAAVWLGFFKPDAMSDAKSVKNLGVKTKRGMQLTQVQSVLDKDGHKTASLFLDKDSVAQQVEINNTDSQGTYTLLLIMNAIQLGQEPISADKLAFKAPDGSHELTADELNANRWFENLDEAKQVAARTHRLVMVDFYAVW